MFDMQPDPKQPTEPTTPDQPIEPGRVPAEPVPAGDPATPSREVPRMMDTDDYGVGTLALTQRNTFLKTEFFY